MKLNLLIGSLMLGASLCTPSFGAGLLDHMLGLRGSGCDSACCDTGSSADPSCGCELSNCGAGCEPTCGVEIAACGDACGNGSGHGSRLGGRLLGHHHAGPNCGCEISACDPCGAAPSCGCEMAAGPCGCDTGCGKQHRKPLRELLGRLCHHKNALLSHVGHRRNACDAGCAAACEPSCGCEMGACGAAPSCGCEISDCGPAACDSGHGAKRCGGLLSRLFHRKNNACDSGCDSYGALASGCNSCGGSVAPSSAPIAAPAFQGDDAPMPPAPVVDPSAYLQSNRRVIQATSYVR